MLCKASLQGGERCAHLQGYKAARPCYGLALGSCQRLSSRRLAALPALLSFLVCLLQVSVRLIRLLRKDCSSALPVCIQHVAVGRVCQRLQSGPLQGGDKLGKAFLALR